ncbi:MAG: Maf family nucleotide pyrophosphatase [Thalassotalea sp.]|nr:Maf family nucleotide pyrophosphatase [Thalassotalea sp.]
MKKIVLASTSPFRRALLEKFNISFTCDKPDIDESALKDETPEQLVARLSLEKAQACANNHSDALIIGSDQVAVHQDRILGKPHTIDNAVAQLTSFSGQAVTFLTGLTVLDTESGEAKTIVEPFQVFFKTLSKESIDQYVNAEMPLNCAGSFKSEGLGICLFEKLSGDDPNSLIGLPMIKLYELLNHFDIDVLAHQ